MNIFIGFLCRVLFNRHSSCVSYKMLSQQLNIIITAFTGCIKRLPAEKKFLCNERSDKDEMLIF